MISGLGLVQFGAYD